MIERIEKFLGGASFHRGLALGALVGAAIAGSTLWTRLRQPRRASIGDAPSEPRPPDSPTPSHPA